LPDTLQFVCLRVLLQFFEPCFAMVLASREGVTPDIITTAKGLTNGSIPMGAVFVAQHIHDAFMQGPQGLIEFFHGYTYSGHPVAAAAALADNEGAPPPKRPPRPHYRGTAKTDAAIAFRRDRAAKPAAPTPADRFRTVDESASWSFDYLSLFSDGDGRSASSSSHSRGAERVPRPASAGARQPPPRPKLATQQLGLEVVRPALADDRAASMRW